MSDLMPCHVCGLTAFEWDSEMERHWCEGCGEYQSGRPIHPARIAFDTRPAAPVEALGEGEAYRGAFMSPSDLAAAVCRVVLAMTEGATFDDEDRRMALTADSELAGMCRAALMPAPVSQGGAVSEDGFMACAEHGPYHVDDSEAFQCPACGAAIKAPAAPASQGADND